MSQPVPSTDPSGTNERVFSLRPNERHTHTIVLLHDRGGSAQQFVNEVFDARDAGGRHLQHVFPTAKWVFLHAPNRYTARFGGSLPQWFDISSLADPEARRDLQVPGLRESIRWLIRVLREEAASVGPGNVFVGGFGQGSCIAVHALLNYPCSTSDAADGAAERLGGALFLSSWMTLGAGDVRGSRDLLGFDGATEASDHIYRNTPVLVTHSTPDSQVSVAQGARLRDVLSAYGMRVEWKEYPNGGHWIHEPDGIEDIIGFLKAHGVPPEVLEEQA
ncbi:phospholipase/carboxylesterase family protein [Xylariomycetidae sp. FL2044]|nr:phospholipase/carboxylesterase family protein [Xylariomycetidae sp. FL2044]